MIDFKGMPVYGGVLHPGLVASLSASVQAQYDLSASTSVFATPLDLLAPATVDRVEVYLAAGASTGFRCRIVGLGTDGLPSSSLVHANAEAAITATAGAWNVFDFTNFSLAGGCYWIVFDSPTGLTSTLRIESMPDSVAYVRASHRSVYWTGSAWASASVSSGYCRVRLKTAGGYVMLPRGLPSIGASGIDNLIMDTLENPACRGNRFVAPWAGEIIGFDISLSNFTANTSYEIVLATQGCAAELGRVEMLQAKAQANFYIHQARFSSPVTVAAGSIYDVYLKAGSLATTTGGVMVSAMDVSDDSGAVIGCYGVAPGDVLGLSVHHPPTEGGSDVPTVTGDHVFPWAPVYGSISTSTGGGGGGRRPRFQYS